jgi:transposase
MADYQMLGLPNVSVLKYQIIGSERIEVQIRSSLEAALCPDCQRISTQIHDTAETQTLRDSPMWDRQCWLRYAPRRFACAHCGQQQNRDRATQHGSAPISTWLACGGKARLPDHRVDTVFYHLR